MKKRMLAHCSGSIAHDLQGRLIGPWLSNWDPATRRQIGQTKVAARDAIERLEVSRVVENFVGRQRFEMRQNMLRDACHTLRV